jgi:hypothetical protein
MRNRLSQGVGRLWGNPQRKLEIFAAYYQLAIYLKKRR